MADEPHALYEAFWLAYEGNKAGTMDVLDMTGIPFSVVSKPGGHLEGMNCTTVNHMKRVFAEVARGGSAYRCLEIDTTDSHMDAVFGYGDETSRMGTYEGLFPMEGVALLYAAPKAGKTTFIVDRLSKWRNQYDPDVPVKSLVISLESGRSAVCGVLAAREMAHRPAECEVVCPGPGELDLLDPVSTKQFAEGLRLELPSGSRFKFWAEAKRLARCASRPDVLVLDSLSRAIVGADENTSTTMSKAMAGLAHLREAFGARLLIVLHHTPQGVNRPRGHGALLAGVDCAVLLTRKGDVVTLKTTDARDIAEGTVRRYKREAKEWTDLAGPSPTYPYMEFTELPGDAPKAKATTSASKPTSAPQSDSEPTAEASTPTPPKKATTGPKLRGLPAKVWAELALVVGGRMSVADARARVLGGAAFATVDTRRRSQKLAQVVAAFAGAGLVDSDHIIHPPPG